MEYSTQLGFPAHQDCANFRNGLCTLNGVAVNPSGAACQNFTPKSIMTTPQAVRAYPRAEQPYQPYSPQIIQGYPPYIPPPTHLPQTGYGYRIRYGSGRVFSAPTAQRQGAVGFLFMSSGRRGRGSGGRGRMGRFAAGPGGSCVCPSCGYSTPHVVGSPCYQQTCPRCGSRMTRGS